MKRILFQGDSITDCGSSTGDDAYLGSGYAAFVQAQLGFDMPGKYEFFNRGISGNRSVDLYARVKEDIINLAPDYLSILIGVNDVACEYSRQAGVSAEKFEKIYCMMIEEIKEALPNIKIMIIEPFCLKGKLTENTPEIPDKWNEFHGEVRKRAEIAKKVADKYQLTFLEMQSTLDRLAEVNGASFWSIDGIHPSKVGNELLKREWIKGFERMKEV